MGGVASSTQPALLGTWELEDGALASQLAFCLQKHFKQGLQRFLTDLRKDRVWFFALYGDSDVTYLGTCTSIHHSALPTDPRQECPDFDFSLHRFLPPSVPILPDVHDVMASILEEPIYDLRTLSWCQPYDGVLVMNPTTLFAVRLCDPEVVYIAPVLHPKQDVREFLALRVVQSQLVDAPRTSMDRMSYVWWKNTLDLLTRRLFSEQYSPLLNAIFWHVHSIHQWVTSWMGFVSSLCWTEWRTLDIDLQRLYVLLDYVYDEDRGAWHRVLRNLKYSHWVAKAVLFVMDQYAGR